jgi:hypothetical protein
MQVLVFVAMSPPQGRGAIVIVKAPTTSASPALRDSFYKVYPTLQMQNKCGFRELSKA